MESVLDIQVQASWDSAWSTLAVTIWLLWGLADGLRAPLLGSGVPGPPHAPTATPLTVAQNFASQSQPAYRLGEQWLRSRENFWRTRWKLHFVIQAQANCSSWGKLSCLWFLFVCFWVLVLWKCYCISPLLICRKAGEETNLVIGASFKASQLCVKIAFFRGVPDFIKKRNISSLQNVNIFHINNKCSL